MTEQQYINQDDYIRISPSYRISKKCKSKRTESGMIAIECAYTLYAVDNRLRIATKKRPIASKPDFSFSTK